MLDPVTSTHKPEGALWPLELSQKAGVAGELVGTVLNQFSWWVYNPAPATPPIDGMFVSPTVHMLNPNPSGASITWWGFGR